MYQTYLKKDKWIKIVVPPKFPTHNIFLYLQRWIKISAEELFPWLCFQVSVSTFNYTKFKYFLWRKLYIDIKCRAKSTLSSIEAPSKF